MCHLKWREIVETHAGKILWCVSGFKNVLFQMAIILFSSILFSVFKHDNWLNGIQANVFTKLVLLHFSVLWLLTLVLCTFLTWYFWCRSPLLLLDTVFSSLSSSCRYVLHVKLKFYQSLFSSPLCCCVSVNCSYCFV